MTADSSHPNNALIIAWFTTTLTFITQHIDVMLSISCGIAALIASVYSIFVNRAKLKYLSVESNIETLKWERARDMDILRAELFSNNAFNWEDKNLRILLVEDDPNDMLLINRMLSKHFIVDKVDTMDKAIDAAEKQKYDCVLLDLTLSDSIAKETVATFINKHPGAVCLAVSGTDIPEVVKTVIEQGACSYLYKGNLKEDYVVRMIYHAITRNKMKIQFEKIVE